MDDTLNRSVDYLVVNHSDGREEKVPLPPAGAAPIRVGREIDNDVVLSDPRASRYHAQVRRGVTGVEIMDADSANGTLVGGRRLKPNTWQLLTPGAVAYLGDTALTIEPALASAATVPMAPVSVPKSPLTSRPSSRSRSRKAPTCRR